MSIPERIARLSKAYYNQVRDGIDAKLSEAERELDATSPVSYEPHPGESDADAMMRRAEERIAAARRDLESRTELANRAADSVAAPVPAVPAAEPRLAPVTGTAQTLSSTTNGVVARAEDPNASDFRVLGVAVGSDLATVTAAYEMLARRCDPRRFPEGSSEQKDAQRILERVNAAFEALRRRLDPTVNRFGKLEFE